VRFQDEENPLWNSMYDYSMPSLLRCAKIRKVEGKSPEEFNHLHVGGTTMCAEYAKRALIRAAELTSQCERECVPKKCKYSNNYPPPSTSKTIKPHLQWPSIYV
jgi:hypothetical protein